MILLHWFRNDLRVHDHRVLGSLPTEVRSLLCVYVLDPTDWRTVSPGFAKTGAYRTRFLLESLHDLDMSLRERGNRLLVIKGQPAVELPKLVRRLGVTLVVTDFEVTDEESAADGLVKAAITPVAFSRAWSRTMLHPEDLPFDVRATPDVFTQFRHKVEHSVAVRSEVLAPKVLPVPPIGVEWTKIPTLIELCNQEPSDDPRAVMRFRGGEAEGAKRLHSYIWERQLVSSYKETRNGLIGESCSSKFSPWLALGCLSPRTVYHQLKQFEQQHGANSGTYWMWFELLWRDFFRFTAMKVGSRLFYVSGMKGSPKQWQKAHHVFEAWRAGTTGDQFVDANMRELRITGWMSNRGRQNVASWLTKTHGIDWRWGARWFEHALVDYDVCSNWGNWAYIAGVGNDPREFRTFNTQLQADRYDTDGLFRALWLKDG